MLSYKRRRHVKVIAEFSLAITNDLGIEAVRSAQRELEPS